MTRVLDEDAHQHDGIILDIGGRRRGIGQQFADAMRRLLGGIGARLGALDDSREVDEFRAMLESMTISTALSMQTCGDAVADRGVTFRM